MIARPPLATSRKRTDELTWSALLALILFVPVTVAAGLAIELLGGIGGGGKLVFLVLMAPMLLLEPLTTGSSEAVSWCIVAFAEYAYLFAIIIAGRAAWRLLRPHVT
jgi:hypothetical protein